MTGSDSPDIHRWSGELIDLGYAVVTRGELFRDLLSAEAHYEFVASLKDDPDLGNQ